MVRRPRSQPRRGAALVEFALILPVLLMLTLGTMVAALGVYRHQQVAAFAREGARYAVVHSGVYVKEQGGSMASASTIQTNVINPLAKASGMSTDALTVTAVYDFTDGAPEEPGPASTTTATVNRVKVTVKYSWQPEFWWSSPINLQATSYMLVWY